MQRSIPAGRLPAVGASAAQGGLPAVAVPAVGAEDHPSQKADQRLGPRVPAIVVSPLIPGTPWTTPHTITPRSPRRWSAISASRRSPLATRQRTTCSTCSRSMPRGRTRHRCSTPRRVRIPVREHLRPAGGRRDHEAGEDGDAEGRRSSPQEKPRPPRRTPRTTRAARNAEGRAAWEEAARRKAANKPGVRTVEILALLREMSFLRRWDARGRMRGIERFQRRIAEPDVRRYVADVRGMVPAAKGSSTSVPSELRPEERKA
jgi:hypothetical protein